MKFPTPTELRVMQFLQKEQSPMYGEQFVQLGIRRGSIYTLLNRLESKELIQGYKKGRHSCYSLTDLGKQVLRW